MGGEYILIPRIIHYCWFGKGEKPAIVKKCIASWKEKLPEYQIIEWNEDNVTISQNKYMREAYAEKKYAFVSDAVRVKALYEMGGFYLDTDVEVFKSFDELLNERCILGFEEGDYVATSFMAAEPQHELIKEFYDLYTNISFYKKNGEINTYTNVKKLTDLLEKRGLLKNGQYQKIKGDIAVYPKEFFSPYDYVNCIYEYTENSFCVHHFYVSWMPVHTRVKKKIKSCVVKVIGKKNMVKLRKRLTN